MMEDMKLKLDSEEKKSIFDIIEARANVAEVNEEEVVAQEQVLS